MYITVWICEKVLRTLLLLSVVERCMNLCVRLFILHVFSGAMIMRSCQVFKIA
jgi:hypothetical protein